MTYKNYTIYDGAIVRGGIYWRFGYWIVYRNGKISKTFMRLCDAKAHINKLIKSH